MISKFIEKYSSETFLAQRGGGKPHLANKVNYYDNFITNKKEFILLPNYYDSDQIKLPPDFNQTTKKECIYIRDTDKPDTVMSEKYFLVLMTLFYWETNQELQLFYNYYRKQGVEKFFMFYNGMLTNRADLPVYDDIEYIEWDFAYYYIFQERRDHHAQVQAMTTFYHKYSNFFDFCIMCDTDEFIYIPDNTISNILKYKYSDINLSLVIDAIRCSFDINKKEICINPKPTKTLGGSKCIHLSQRLHKTIHHKIGLPIHGTLDPFYQWFDEAQILHRRPCVNTGVFFNVKEDFWSLYN